MDWYFRRDCEDFIVPCDHETSGNQQADDRSPYLDGWLQWEVGRTKNSEPPNKFLSTNMEPIVTGLNSNWNSLYENVDMQSCILDGEGSSNQSAYGDFSFIDNTARTLDASFYDEKSDDFWESAFIEDPPIMKRMSNSCNSAYKSMSFGNHLTDMLMDPHDSPNDPSIMGSTVPKVFFSPLIDELVEDEDQVDDVSPSSMTETSRSPGGSPTVKASVLSVLVPAEQTTSVVVGHVQEKKLLETTVLQALEGVMSQLNVETRICFRDALYRLAKISKKHHSFIKSRPTSDVVGEKSCRGSRPKSAESKTNAIDRTVANLMFSKPDSCAQDFLCQGSVHQYVESCQNAGTCDKQPVIHPHRRHPVSQPHCFNAPMCRQENSNDGHSSCIFSSFMPAGGMNYISGISSYQADDSLAIADRSQLGANQQLKFRFATALPHNQQG